MTMRGWRFGHAEWFLAMSTALLIGLAAFVASRPDLVQALDRTFADWRSVAVQYGYVGVFVSMLIGNLTIVVVLPTTIVPFLAASAGFNPIAVGVLSGLGAELGELSGYFLGLWGSRAIERRNPEGYATIRELIRRRPRLIPVLLFCFSLLPLPDDVLFVPLGLARYPLWKLFWPSVLGKISAGLVIGLGGSLTRQLIVTPLVSTGDLWLHVGSLFVLILIVYGMWRMPWWSLLRRLNGPHAVPET